MSPDNARDQRQKVWPLDRIVEEKNHGSKAPPTRRPRTGLLRKVSVFLRGEPETPIEPFSSAADWPDSTL